MNTILMSELIEQAKNILVNKGYSQSTIRNYLTVWKRYEKYCLSKNVKFYSNELRKEFFIKYYKFNPDKKINVKQKRRVSILNVLENINNGVDITYKCLKQSNIPDVHIKYYNDYINYLTNTLELAKSTIIHRKSAISKMLIFIGNTSLNTIDVNQIYLFINSLQSYSLATKSLITENIRHFLDYLYNNKIISFSGKKIFPIIKSNRKSTLISFYSRDEIDKLLSSIDISTKVGKRDYVVLLLAIQLGLRTSDIMYLKFDNIKWNENKIILEQSKTKEKIEFILLENIKLALCDYLKNVRPTSNEPYIFLTLVAPYRLYSPSSFYYISKKYISIAKLDKKNRKKGLHSMRHSLASNLILENTPLPVIKSILGHTSIESTNTYLSIDINNLRKMSMEVPDERKK